MKRNLLLIMLAFFSLSGNAQSWQWAKRAGGYQANDASNSITTDIHGRVYITGSFAGDTIVFGNDSAINTTNHNSFVTKYDEAGNALWTRGSIGNSNAAGKAIATDINGNIYVTGTFFSSTDTAVIFGTDTLANIAGAGFASDIYVIKYDSTGTVLWAKRAGGMGSDISLGIDADNNGNVYVTGYMGNGYVINDSLNFGASTIFYNGVGNMFLLKYSSTGNPIWARTQGGNGSTQAHGVATDSIGNIYVTGSYIDSAITFGTTTLPAPGAIQFMFLTKYNTNGNVLWAKGMGGTKDDNALAVITDHGGNVFISGDIKSTTTFGTYTLTNTTGTSYYMFIAKYDSSGTALWAKGGSLGNFNFGYGMIADPMNNVYVTGLFKAGISFDSITSIPSGNGLFIVKYTAAGNVVWAKSVISTLPAHGIGITIDASQSLYVTGYTQSTVAFGNDTLHLTGTQNIFLAKLSNSNVGIEEIPLNNNSIYVYPNPSNGIFTIDDLRFTNLDLRLIDVFGRTVYSTKINNANRRETIIVPNLPDGIYFWEVVSENKVIGNGKIVFMK